MEGAGVHLHRAFGFGDPGAWTRSCCSTISATKTRAITARLPWHPHRGIETITYVLAGAVEHGDSLGNRGHAGAAMCSG
jgi:quercetin 2,3-dioxygenase